MRDKAIILCGPTGSGKSGLALALAAHLPVEIINADSLQIYKELPLLTAQPTEGEKPHVPHHLYGILSSTDACSAARWLDLACPVMDAILARGRIPLIVGGTGLYVKALLEGLSPIPTIELTIRKRVRTLSHQLYGKAFYDYVMKEDPTLEGRFNINDRQRLARALEVKWQTGHSIVHFQQGAQPPRPYSYFKIFLSPPRPKLYAQINSRFETMINKGALEEVQALISQYGQGASTLFKAIGLRELNAYLLGEWTLPEAISKAQQHSRNYAKRQSTWFRHQFLANLTLEDADLQATLTAFTQWAHPAQAPGSPLS